MHPRLVEVVERAIELTTQDFSVTDGLRTQERQKELVASGAGFSRWAALPDQVTGSWRTGKEVEEAIGRDGRIRTSITPVMSGALSPLSYFASDAWKAADGS